MWQDLCVMMSIHTHTHTGMGSHCGGGAPQPGVENFKRIDSVASVHVLFSHVSFLSARGDHLLATISGLFFIVAIRTP